MMQDELLRIVPDADFDEVPDDADLREELELDSLDFLVLVERLGIRAGCRIEESDYPSLASMRSSIDLLIGKTSQQGAGSQP